MAAKKPSNTKVKVKEINPIVSSSTCEGCKDKTVCDKYIKYAEKLKLGGIGKGIKCPKLKKG
jgi:hypothetical protein